MFLDRGKLGKIPVDRCRPQLPIDRVHGSYAVLCEQSNSEMFMFIHQLCVHIDEASLSIDHLQTMDAFDVVITSCRREGFDEISRNGRRMVHGTGTAHLTGD
jgi:hypothetical protein